MQSFLRVLFLITVLFQLGAAQDLWFEVFAPDTNYQAGDTVQVEIRADMTGVPQPDNALGAFTLTLNWDPAVMQFIGHTGLQSGFTGMINTDTAGSGYISFNGVNPGGGLNKLNLLKPFFIVSGKPAMHTELFLEIKSAAAACTFKNLLPLSGTISSKITIVHLPGSR